MMTLHNREDIPVTLIGSWTTAIGPIQDQAGNVHIICIAQFFNGGNIDGQQATCISYTTGD